MARVAWSVQRTTSSTSHTLYSNFNWLHDKTQLSKPFSYLVGGYTARVTPVPIPNTVVKPRRADGTAREIVWESTTSPAFISKASLSYMLGGAFMHLVHVAA